MDNKKKFFIGLGILSIVYIAIVGLNLTHKSEAKKDDPYSKEKVIDWMLELEKVYNRGFWSGYYLGQKLGEWSKGSGSHATQKKVYLGKGMHYFPKPKIGEFKIEAYDIAVGDTILVTGPTTGAQEMQVSEMYVNDKKGEKGQKGDSVTIPLEFRIRPSDKLYKIVENKVEA